MSENINQDVNIKGKGNIVVGRGDVIINPLPPAEARERRDLGILLKNVDTTWIKGVLEHSVHEAALLELGIETRPDAVEHPWQMVMETPDQERQVLPAGTKIKTVFEEANRLLLILGEPGAGKTTTLLQLARDLMSEIDPTFTQPIPVIFNLSTWIDKRQPLADWLIVELQSKYRVPKKQGSRWLEERRILPLLDGLDEVKLENQNACVEQINQLVVEYGLQGTVVCSRVQDYTALNKQLQFSRAVFLQSLSLDQIDEYIKKAGEKLSGLRIALQQNKALRNLAHSPLMLNIMSLAFQGSPGETTIAPELPTEEAYRQSLFDAYIERMFRRRGNRGAEKAKKITRKLSWVAQTMKGQNQEVFLIEGLQPICLQNKQFQFIYILVSRLLSGVIVLFCVSQIFPLFNSLIYGLSAGLLLSFIDLLRFRTINRVKRKTSLSVWWKIINFVIVGLLFGLMFGLSQGIKDGEPYGIYTGIFVGLVYWLIFGLFFGLRGSRQSLTNDIQLVEALGWNWRQAFKGCIIGWLAGSLIVVLMLWTMDKVTGDSQELVYVILVGLFIGIIGAPIGSIFNGIHREILEAKNNPNQGILLSIRNSVSGGFIVGIVGLEIGMLFVFFSFLDNKLFEGLRLAISFALCFGLLGILWYGGLDIIQHYTLRLILTLQGYIPRNYAHFLDSCVDLIFLQKAGVGYRFIHRMLLEHFAEMEHLPTKPSPPL